jgi:Fe2+ transport system protein FeoA
MVKDIIGIELNKLPKTKTPVLTYCRKLIDKGFDPGTRLEVMRNGRVDIIALEIGKAAKLTVKEETNDGRPRFAVYQPPQRLRVAA